MAHFSTVTLRLLERYATALILDVAFDESFTSIKLEYDLRSAAVCRS